jgi:hypothetical protein
MRGRVRRALFTAVAAGATVSLGLAAAGPAGAAGHGVKVFTPSGGTPIPTDANCAFTPPTSPPHGPALPSTDCARAGYQASGRDFRFVQALITVPDHLGSISSADPVLYVALDDSGNSGAINSYQYIRVGIAPCPEDTNAFVVPGGRVTCPSVPEGNTSNWVAFAATATGDTVPPGTPPNLVVQALSSAVMGDGILVNAYLVPTGNAVHTVIQLPDGTTYNNTFPVIGPTYPRAQAVADWTTAVENGASKPQPAVPAGKGRISQFFQGRFTTLSGQGGTFAGPWTLNALEATSNGTLPPTGTLIAQPSYLWNDQKGLSGLGQDAFGVWSYPF